MIPRIRVIAAVAAITTAVAAHLVPALAAGSAAPRLPALRPDEPHPGAPSPDALHDPTGLLREVGRFAFPPVFRPRAAVALAGFSYVLTDDGILVTLDAADGTETDRLTPEFPAHGLKLVVTEGTPRLVVPTAQAVIVYGLADPAHPAAERFLQSDCGRGVHPLPGGALAVLYGRSCAAVTDLRTGAIYPAFGPGAYYVAAGGSAAAPVVALRGEDEVITVWDLSDPAQPTFRTALSAAGYRPLAVDRAGEIVVTGGSDTVEVFSAVDGTLLATLDSRWDEALPGLVESGGLRILALPTHRALDLWDLADPAAPRRIERVPFDGSPSLAVSSGEPLLFAVDGGQRAVHAIDPRTGAILGTHFVDGLYPRALALSATPGDGRAIVVTTYAAGRLDVPGIAGSVDRVRFDDLSAPRLASRHAPLGLADVGAVAPLLGHLVAVLDNGTGAIFVKEIRTGETFVSGGLGFQPSAFELRVDSEGTALAFADDYAYEVLDLDLATRTLRRRAIDAPEASRGAYDVAIASDGTAVAFGGGRVDVIDPAGHVASLPLDAAANAIDLSPDGRSALLIGDGWREERDVVLVDLADRAAPRIVWRRDGEFNGAHFVDGGARILATAGSWWTGTFVPKTLSVATGEVLGVGPEVWQFFYHGFGLQQGTGAAARAVFWKWTLPGESTVVFDVSTDTPRLVMDACASCSVWYYQPRGDGTSWYETHPTWSEVNEVWVGDGDGGYAFHDTADLGVGHQTLVRRGFLAGTPTARPRRNLVVLRDLAMNRPPVADPGAAMPLECAGPGGTPATLDASASSDPDSTPGTDDDIVTFEWTVDGTPAGEGKALPVTLATGDHAVGLVVRDALDAPGAGATTVAVRDTLPADLTLALDPVVTGGVFAHAWVPTAGATDRCDGRLAPDLRLALGADVLDAPVRFAQGPVFEIIVRRGAAASVRGPEITLAGPDRAQIDAWWAAARGRGGLPLADGRAVVLATSAPGAVGVVARYRLDADGVVSSAEAFGSAPDHVIAARAHDRAGHLASQATTLRERLAALCAAAPASAVCTER